MNKSKISTVIILINMLVFMPSFCTATTYTYDDLHRLTKVEYTDGRWIEYSYDKAGNMKSVNMSSFPGDVNADKEITLSDAIQAMRYCTEGGSTSGELNKLADVNNDGKLSMPEALFILKRLASTP